MLLAFLQTVVFQKVSDAHRGFNNKASYFITRVNPSISEPSQLSAF